MGFSTTPLRAVLFGIALLAVLAYLPSQFLPLISDDYLQIWLARDYGGIDGWAKLAADPLYRCRATSLVLTHWTEKLFGVSPLAFSLSSLLVHICNGWLVFLIGVWRPLGWKLSGLAAAFFVINELPQEAVMWYAALPELLVFTFILLTFLFWILWLQRGSRLYYAVSLVCFGLALLSKESAVAVVGFQVLAVILEREKLVERFAQIMPFLFLSAVYFALIYGARSQHLHFNDGTFSLSAPFLATIGNSIGRLLWIWGMIALIVIVQARLWKIACIAGAWAIISLLPYSFLTYMPRVPSRHSYLASVAVAILVATAAMAWQARPSVPRWAPAMMAAIILLHNCTYLWTWKQQQYESRAAPTEELVRFAEQNDGPVFVHCFRYGEEVAQLALKIRMPGDNRELVWLKPASTCSADFLFSSSGDFTEDPVARETVMVPF